MPEGSRSRSPKSSASPEVRKRSLQVLDQPDRSTSGLTQGSGSPVRNTSRLSYGNGERVQNVMTLKSRDFNQLEAKEGVSREMVQLLIPSDLPRQVVERPVYVERTVAENVYLRKQTAVPYEEVRVVNVPIPEPVVREVNVYIEKEVIKYVDREVVQVKCMHLSHTHESDSANELLKSRDT